MTRVTIAAQLFFARAAAGVFPRHDQGRKLRRMEHPWLIIVTGLPATGKTRLARTFAQQRGWPLLPKDMIKEWLFDRLGSSDAAWSRQLSDASFAILFALARDLITYPSSLVLEGNFRPGEHDDALRSILPTSGSSAPRCLQVLCRVDEVERRRRLDARAADPDRHPGHLDAVLHTAARTADAFLDLPSERLIHNSSDAAFDDVLARLTALLS